MTEKSLPQNITSYDLLKTFAVLVMIVDHLGWYFSPDDLWWRAVGRIGFPIWFFLVGYAKGRDLGWKLWLGALLLFPFSLIAGMSLFPLNALVTIIVIRLVLEPLMRGAMSDFKTFTALSCVLFVLILPTSMFVEYGTQGIILAMLGYLVRHRMSLDVSLEKLSLFALFSWAGFIVVQHMMFGFSESQLTFMAVGTSLVIIVLCFFRSVEYGRLTIVLPGVFVKLIQFGGRRTLEIYVVHLLLFKMLGMYLYPARFAFLEWDLFFTTL